MAAPSNPAEQAIVDEANAYLDTYQGSNNFMNDIMGKRQRIKDFRLSVRQAEVVMKIADQQWHQQQQKAEDDSQPF